MLELYFARCEKEFAHGWKANPHLRCNGDNVPSIYETVTNKINLYKLIRSLYDIKIVTHGFTARA